MACHTSLGGIKSVYFTDLSPLYKYKESILCEIFGVGKIESVEIDKAIFDPISYLTIVTLIDRNEFSKKQLYSNCYLTNYEIGDSKFVKAEFQISSNRLDILYSRYLRKFKVKGILKNK